MLIGSVFRFSADEKKYRWIVFSKEIALFHHTAGSTTQPTGTCSKK